MEGVAINEIATVKYTVTVDPFANQPRKAVPKNPKKMRLEDKWLTTANRLAVVLLTLLWLPQLHAFGTTSLKAAPSVNCCDCDINGVDGPYVFYKRNKVVVKNLSFKQGKAKVDQREFMAKDEVGKIVVTVDNEEKTQFTVQLHSDYEIPPTKYPQPDRLFAISDIEGNFKAFQHTLKGNGVIDRNYNWAFGDGHLVLIGDFFDRGKNVTAVLWLIYELERQALEHGGMVHFIIGNHEEMNLRGDTRYVEEKYKLTAKALKINHPGLYSTHTELGRWIRSKNTVEKIGKTIFVHGGISPELADAHYRLEEINKISRKNLGKDRWRLNQKGGMAKTIFNEYGPMWYRGYFSSSTKPHRVNRALDLYGAKKVVVGHTVVPVVSSLFNERVIGIDVKHKMAVADGTANALLIEGDEFFAVNVIGSRTPISPLLCEDDIVKVFTAIKNGDIKSVKHFLKRDKRINKYYTKKQYTLMHFAIKHRQLDIVELLTQKGADIEQHYEHKTPLMYAIALGRNDIARLLITKGADIDAENAANKTPLFYCAKYNNMEMAEVLITQGADFHHRDRKGRTAADYAVKHQNVAVANFLRELR